MRGIAQRAFQPWTSQNVEWLSHTPHPFGSADHLLPQGEKEYARVASQQRAHPRHGLLGLGIIDLA